MKSKRTMKKVVTAVLRRARRRVWKKYLRLKISIRKSARW
jgi:hypothetical protein